MTNVVPRPSLEVAGNRVKMLRCRAFLGFYVFMAECNIKGAPGYGRLSSAKGYPLLIRVAA